MIDYQNLHLIGSSHISPESIHLVRRVIQEKKPQFVALELDTGRLHALLEKGGKKKKLSFQEFRKLGFSGFLFALFGAWLEEKLGKIVGTKPGGEMKAAVYEAAKIDAKILLIDQDIHITLKRLFKALTFQEKLRFVWDFLKGLFGVGERMRFDLRKVPEEEVIEKMIVQVRERYPSFYTVLIEERNIFMAKKLQHAMQKHPESQIVAVVGAGHEKAIVSLLKKANASSS